LSFASSKPSLIFSLVLEPLSGANKIPTPAPIAARHKRANTEFPALFDIVSTI